MLRHALAAVLMLAAGTAEARTIQFGFDNVDGNVAGTVVGAFDVADGIDFGRSQALDTRLVNLRLVSVPDGFGWASPQPVGQSGFRCIRYCVGAGPHVASTPPVPVDGGGWTSW